MKTTSVSLKNGDTIHTCIAGNPSHPPLVLLHGWPVSHLLWRNIIPDLSDQFYVIAPDLPGHGHSDKPADCDYDLDFFTKFVLNFIDAMSLETTSLAAHDLGGMAALSFAAKHPDRLDKLIIMNTSPYAISSYRLRLSLFLLRQPILARFLLHPIVFKQVLKPGIHNTHLLTRELIDCFRTPWLSDKNSINAFSKTINAPLDDMVEPVDSIKSITLPTLILWGKKDIFFPFQIARQLHQDLENSTLVGIENAAHFCQEEEPQFIARSMKAFMKGEQV